MIGGRDLQFRTAEWCDVPALIYPVVELIWPDFVVENADDASPPFCPRNAAGDLVHPTTDGYFVYRDSAAAAAWERLGAEPENEPTMIYVIEDARPENGVKRVSITCSTRDDEGYRLARAVGHVLEQTIRPRGNPESVGAGR